MMSEIKPSLQDAIKKFDEAIMECSVVLISTLITIEQENQIKEERKLLVIARDAMRAQFERENENSFPTTQHRFILSSLSTPEKMARWFMARNMETSFDFCEERPECKEISDRGSLVEDEQCLKCFVKFLNASGVG